MHSLATNCRLALVLFAKSFALVLCLTASAVSAEFDRLTQDIQSALLEYGYRPGPADGLFGSKTERAIRQFQNEFRVDETGRADEQTAYQLGMFSEEAFAQTEIFVLNTPTDEIAARLTGLDRIGVANALEELRKQSLSKINMVFEKPKTVIFVSVADFQPGDIVFTQIEVIRKDRPMFYENFYYEISEDTPTEPLVIINEAEAGWELQFTHRIGVNGKIIGQKRTRAAR